MEAGHERREMGGGSRRSLVNFGGSWLWTMKVGFGQIQIVPVLITTIILSPERVPVSTNKGGRCNLM